MRLLRLCRMEIAVRDAETLTSVVHDANAPKVTLKVVRFFQQQNTNSTTTGAAAAAAATVTAGTRYASIAAGDGGRGGGDGGGGGGGGAKEAAVTDHRLRQSMNANVLAKRLE